MTRTGTGDSGFRAAVMCGEDGGAGGGGGGGGGGAGDEEEALSTGKGGARADTGAVGASFILPEPCTTTRLTWN